MYPYFQVTYPENEDNKITPNYFIRSKNFILIFRILILSNRVLHSPLTTPTPTLLLEWE
jgi:hypothetical protein